MAYLSAISRHFWLFNGWGALLRWRGSLMVQYAIDMVELPIVNETDDLHPGASDRFLRESGLAGEVAALTEPVLVDLGFRLVRAQVSGRDASRVVQIMAERGDGTISVDDCEAISRALSPVLDVANVVAGAYRLEVSSPGIDRPLVRPADFELWSGYEAKIELKEAIDGRKRFRGVLEGFEDGEVRLATTLDQLGEQHLGFPVTLIADAKLVLTDELIREALARAKERHSGRPADGAEIDPDELED